MSGTSWQFDGPNDPDGPGGGQSAPANPRRRGSASVTLRQRGESDGVQNVGPLIDPATKSLGDALRISYRLLQLSMVLLVGLYLLSGFQSIKESERGIRLLFGRVESRDLPSGFQFSFPAPIGELVKVQTGLQTQDLNREFFPRLSETEEKQMTDKDKGAQSLAEGGPDSLDPDADGQLLTADGNIVHARWTVDYQRTQAWLAAQNIDPEFERKIVTAAASQGIVHAAASLPIDDILKKQVESDSTQQVGRSKIELRAKEEAQLSLDRIESGITITQLAMTTVIPPRYVMKQFEEVQAAQSKRSTLVEQARTSRADTLTTMAGASAPIILTLIDTYERQLGLGERDKAVVTLGQIESVLKNEEVQIDGRVVKASTSGDVTATISNALQYRSSVVNDAQGEVAFFEAKRALFDSNPLVMIHGDWSEAFTKFMSGDTLQSIWLPPGTSRQTLELTRDPRIAADQEKTRNLKEATEFEAKRQAERRRQQWIQRTDPESRKRTE